MLRYERGAEGLVHVVRTERAGRSGQPVHEGHRRHESPAFDARLADIRDPVDERERIVVGGGRVVPGAPEAGAGRSAGVAKVSRRLDLAEKRVECCDVHVEIGPAKCLADEALRRAEDSGATDARLGAVAERGGIEEDADGRAQDFGRF